MLQLASKTLKNLEAMASREGDIGRTLEELRAAARSIRIMAEYLERHPEALLCAADVAYARGETESYLALLEEMVAKDPAYAQFIDEEDPELLELERFRAILEP